MEGPDQDGMNCAHCGSKTGFDQYGQHFLMRDTSFVAVNALFEGKMDEARCEVCDHGLGFRQSISVYLSDPPEILTAPGDLLKQHAATGMRLLRAEFEKFGVASISV